MLEFKSIKFSDVPLLREYLYKYASRSCDYALCSLFMWRDYYKNRFAVYDDTLILSSFYEGEMSFYWPIGKNPYGMIDEIKSFCSQNHTPVIFLRVSADEKDKISEIFPDCKVLSDRDWSDYIYNASDVTKLTGKAYSQKRNQIHKFEKNYDDFSFETIDKTNIHEIIEFNKNFEFSADKSDDSADFELNACTELLENYDLMNFPGYLLRIDGNVEGYTVGEIIGDTLFIQIEKANTEYRGIYQILFYLFLNKMADDKIIYVNREDDCGDPGLRKSKLSYNPVYLLEKFKVICN